MKIQHVFASSVLMALSLSSIANAQLLGGSGALNGALNGGMNGNLSPGRDALGGSANGNLAGSGAADAGHAMDRAGALSSHAKSATEHLTAAGASKIEGVKDTVATTAANTKSVAIESSQQLKDTVGNSVTTIKDKSINTLDRIKPTVEAAATGSVDVASSVGKDTKDAARSTDAHEKRSASAAGAAASDTLNKDKPADTTKKVNAKDTSLQNTIAPTASASASTSDAKARQSTNGTSQVHAGNANSQANPSANSNASVTRSNANANGSGSVSVDASTP